MSSSASILSNASCSASVFLPLFSGAGAFFSVKVVLLVAGEGVFHVVLAIVALRRGHAVRILLLRRIPAFREAGVAERLGIESAGFDFGRGFLRRI